MPAYRTTGHLTGHIETENVAAAQHYLLFYGDTPINMQQYLDPPLKGVVELLEWTLHADGYNYHVTAIANRELTDAELKQLSSEVSGQNSDGLGEGFEQQPFAELGGEEEVACEECSGNGDLFDDETEEYSHCENCDGNGYFNEDNYGMISFDWQDNILTFERIA